MPDSNQERYFRIIRKPRVTEKSLKMAERDSAFPFEVDADANKIEIRNAVEKIFNVKVRKVRTQNYLGKLKRTGRWYGRRPAWKKAIVVLEKGQTIEDFY